MQYRRLLPLVILFFTLTFFTFTARLLAQSNFSDPVAYSSAGYYPLSVAVADVNGDGKPDLLVANYGGTVGVLLGNGDGTFQPAISYGSGEDNVWVVLADVNADGKPDILVANGGSSKAAVLLGNGDGTFQADVTYSSGGYIAEEVAVADVNADGKPDLVVANACVSENNCVNGTASVLLNNGDGTFQPATAYGSGGYYAQSVAVADINGDGKPDLLVGNSCIANDTSCYNFTPGLPSTVGVLLGNGDGTFQSAVSYATGDYYSLSVVVADVNGDGRADLLVAKGGSSTVAVLLGNGDGTFQPAIAYGSGGYYATSVAVADVNGDGKPDLVVANCTLKSTGGCNNGAVTGLGVLLGNGNGTFQSAEAYGSGGFGEATSVAVADVNADGKPDLVVANLCAKKKNCTNGSVAVLSNKFHSHKH
jgi:FG-GAP-like repeat